MNRNDPCHCGSGKKYKRCCEAKNRARGPRLGPSRRDLKLIRRELDKKSGRQLATLRKEYGIQVNYVSPISYQGKRVWALGNRVYANRPPKETFHEFILSVLKVTLGGEPWRLTQMALPEGERHFIMKCFLEYSKFITDEANWEARQEDGTYSRFANGYVMYLQSLAWDIASLIHKADLPESLMKRLLDPNAYQGARYEIAVAAIIARLDFEIRFLDEEEQLRRQKRVEFEATHRPTGIKLAVEAKSRHRAGIIHQEGEPVKDDPLSGDARAVRALYKAAVEKAPVDLPYLIFLDINAPMQPERGDLDKDWIRDIMRWMGRFPTPTPETPDPFTAFIVTNFAPHYEKGNIAKGGEYLIVAPLYARHPVNHIILRMLDKALSKNQHVPEFGEDGQIKI